MLLLLWNIQYCFKFLTLYLSPIYFIFLFNFLWSFFGFYCLSWSSKNLFGLTLSFCIFPSHFLSMDCSFTALSHTCLSSSILTYVFAYLSCMFVSNRPSICLSNSVSFSLHHYLSLFRTLFHSSSLSFSLHHCVSFFITLSHSSSLCFSLNHSLSLFITLFLS